MPPKAAKAQEVESDELDGLDEELAALESLGDLDELDLEEPEDVEQPEEKVTTRKRAASKPAAKKAAKTEPEEVELEEDDELDLEDDAEVDPLAELDRAALKTLIKDKDLDIKVYKSMTDDDLRDSIRGELAGEGAAEEEEIEEVELVDDAPKRSKAKPPSTVTRTSSEPAKKRQSGAPAGTDLLSPTAVAEICKCDENKVRALLRDNPKAFPKATPKSRYALNPIQVRAVVKKLWAD